jgi:hypothetical protein
MMIIREGRGFVNKVIRINVSKRGENFLGR